MAIYHGPEVMLICASKYTTSGTAAKIKLLFSWVYDNLFYLPIFIWVFFGFVVLEIFLKENWCIKQRYDDGYHSYIFRNLRVMFITAISL